MANELQAQGIENLPDLRDLPWDVPSFWKDPETGVWYTSREELQRLIFPGQSGQEVILWKVEWGVWPPYLIWLENQNSSDEDDIPELEPQPDMPQPHGHNPALAQLDLAAGFWSLPHRN